MAVGTIESVSELVRKYYLLLIEAGIAVERIILFGSYANGKPNESSDIDVAVILKKYSEDRFNTRLELMKYSREFEEVIEPHPFLASEFNKSDPFAFEIIKTGVEISLN
ncbi:MAG: nucleotidyltransferase domain-containing protein [Ignavibacteria bacterium]|jgi:predicted nucleotidyltransferase